MMSKLNTVSSTLLSFPFCKFFMLFLIRYISGLTPFIIERVAWIKPRLLPKNILQNAQTLQLITMKIKTESNYKPY